MLYLFLSKMLKQSYRFLSFLHKDQHINSLLMSFRTKKYKSFLYFFVDGSFSQQNIFLLVNTSLGLFYFKTMRAIMPDEIQLSSSVANRNISLLYQYNNIEAENELALFKKYLNGLLYDISPSKFTTQLPNQDVFQLKEAITLLYRAYKQKKVLLTEIQGVWPLLTFRFSKRSGLQLYLAFQNLAQQVVIVHSQVKQQYQQFNQKGFFQNNNNWLKDKKFVTALRVIERSCLKPTFEQNNDKCLKLLQILIDQKVDLMVKSKQFVQEFKKFKSKAVKICKDKEMLKRAMLQRNILNQQRLMDGFIMSEPGDFTHILQNFNKEDFVRIQSCQHQNIKIQQNESRVRSLYNQPIQQGHLEKSIIEGKAYQSTQIKSSSTKRRIPEDNLSNQFIEHYEPRTRRNLYRRPPRFKFIARLYNFEKENQKKEIKFKEIKRQKEKADLIKKNNIKVQKRTQKRLRKLNKSYYSDQQKKVKRVHKPKKQTMREEREEEYCLQESVSWSSSQQIQEQRSERMSIESSESITMKRKRPTKNQVSTRNNKYQKQFMEDQYEFNNRNDEHFFQRFQQSENLSKSRLVNYDRDSAPIFRNPQIMKRKQCSNLKFLKQSKIQKEQKCSESLQNLSVRVLQLNEHEQLQISINISQYLWYLQSLQQKQIKKEIIQVSLELLTRQYQHNDINMIIKILGLFIISEDKGNQQSQLWQKFKNAYIDHMLKHCLSVSFYCGFSEILNNLTVGSFNQDLSNLSKLKKYFYYLFEIVHNYDFMYKGIEERFVKIIYELFPTPQKLQCLLKNQQYNFKINLESAFKVGTNLLKFQLAPKDKTIAFTISAFIFQQLILQEFVGQTTNYETIRKQYFESFIKDMQLRKAEPKQWLMKFNHLIKQFYEHYQPKLNKTYFTSLANLITISLSNLMIKVLETDEQSKQIKVHADFLQSICKRFLSQSDLTNKSSLLNTLLIQTKISSNYREIIPQKIQTMIIYPTVLNALWNFKDFRDENRALFNTTKLYLEEKVQKALDQNYFELKNPLVSESLSKLIKTIYKVKLMSKLRDQSSKFTVQDLNRQQKNIQDISLSRLRKIISVHFRQLDKFLEEDLKYEIRNMKQKKGKSSIKMSQEMVVRFLNSLILPSKKKETDSQDQECDITNSISHYFFGLKLILEQNFFQKYFKYKVNHKIDAINQFLKKGTQILNFYFAHSPNFIDKIHLQANPQAMVIQPNGFEKEGQSQNLMKKHKINEQLNREYYQFINSHFNKRSKLQLQQQVQIINLISQPYYSTTLANIYSSHMISYLEIMTQQTILSNPITKYIRDSAIGINGKKIEKSVYFLTCIFRQLQYYLNLKERFSKESCFSGNKTAQSEALSKKIKKQFNSTFLLCNAKHIVIVVICGFALKNSQEFTSMPLDKLIQSFAKVQPIEKEHLSHLQTDSGYLHFIYAMQCLKASGNLSDILGNLLWIGNKTPKLNEEISKMLSEIYLPLRQLLNLQQDRSIIILQSLKILTFAVNWSEVYPQCIKKFLNDMQVISKAQSLIQKIPITQKNVETILQLFEAISNSKYDYYQIKKTMTIYVELVCSSQKPRDKEDGFYKKIEKLLLCLHQICNNQSRLVKQGKTLVKELLGKLMELILNYSGSQSTSAVKRLDIFCEMLKLSQVQRPLYQIIVIEKRQSFQKAITNLRPSPDKICNFQQFVQKLMISQHSEFTDIKRLISSLISQNVYSNSKKQYFLRVLQKMKRCMQRSEANLFLLGWCEQEMRKLRKQNTISMIEQYGDWMDFQ